MLKFAVVLLAVVCMVHGYPTGAPVGRCGSMQPGHGNASTTTNPFSISVSTNSYGAGSTVEVTVKGTFKGVLLQARKADGSSTTQYGTFTVESDDAVQLLQCTNAGDAVTHSSTDDKMDLKVMWTAPSSDMGEMEFVATVLTDAVTYWMNTKSETLSFDADAGNASQGVSATGVLVVCAAALGVLKQML